MIKFLNQFSKKCQKHDDDQNRFLVDLFRSFVESTTNLPANAFMSKKTKRFSIALVEAVFVGAAHRAFAERRPLNGALSKSEIDSLAADEGFQDAATKASTSSANVETRLLLGKKYITPL